MSEDLTASGLSIDLASTGAIFSPVELRLPKDMGQQDWARIGVKLHRTEQVVQWWIGDWAAFGSPHTDAPGWRKKGALMEFCKAHEFDYGTISTKAWISRSIHLSLRRESVPLSYFGIIAPLKPKEQKLWLERIEKEKLTRGALRTAINVAHGEDNALLSDGPRIEFGTKYFDDLKGWMMARPAGFFSEDRGRIWRERLAELLGIVDRQEMA